MNFESIHEYLNALSEKHGLVNLAMESCRKHMDIGWRISGEASLGGFSKEELELVFDRQEFIFKDSEFDRTVIRTRIALYVDDAAKVLFGGLAPVGYYEMDTDQQGKWVYDCLDFVQEKDDKIGVVSKIRDLNTLLLEDGLQPSSVYYEYISYVHHVVALYQSHQYEAAAHNILRAFSYLKENRKLVSGKLYFKKSRHFLKIILFHLLKKGLLTESLIAQLKEIGIIKDNNIG